MAPASCSSTCASATVQARWRRTFDFFGEIFNVTNRANFVNPCGDLRNSTDFLRLAGLVAVTGLPRQGQLGLRFGF